MSPSLLCPCVRRYARWFRNSCSTCSILLRIIASRARWTADDEACKETKRLIGVQFYTRPLSDLRLIITHNEVGLYILRKRQDLLHDFLKILESLQVRLFCLRRTSEIVSAESSSCFLGQSLCLQLSPCRRTFGIVCRLLKSAFGSSGSEKSRRDSRANANGIKLLHL